MKKNPTLILVSKNVAALQQGECDFVQSIREK
jgi:hypothetical protein